MDMTSEMQALKTRLKATWMAGDYEHFSQYLDGDLEQLWSAHNGAGDHGTLVEAEYLQVHAIRA